MKNVPKIIYLQVEGYRDHEPSWYNGCVTWCEDRVNDTDIQYIRKDIYDAMKKNLQQNNNLVKPDSAERLLGSDR